MSKLERRKIVQKKYHNSAKGLLAQARARTKYHTKGERIAQRNYNLKSQFGLSESQYNALADSQGFCCAICRQPEGTGKGRLSRRLAVDHCHVTGKNRGLLCTNCNLGLGNFKDEVLRLQAAITYLQREG